MKKKIIHFFYIKVTASNFFKILTTITKKSLYSNHPNVLHVRIFVRDTRVAFLRWLVAV